MLNAGQISKHAAKSRHDISIIYKLVPMHTRSLKKSKKLAWIVGVLTNCEMLNTGKYSCHWSEPQRFSLFVADLRQNVHCAPPKQHFVSFVVFLERSRVYNETLL